MIGETPRPEPGAPRRSALLPAEATEFVAVARAPDQVFFGMTQRGLGRREAVTLFTEMTDAEALDLAERIVGMVEANRARLASMPETDPSRPGWERAR